MWVREIKRNKQEFLDLILSILFPSFNFQILLTKCNVLFSQGRFSVLSLYKCVTWCISSVYCMLFKILFILMHIFMTFSIFSPFGDQGRPSPNTSTICQMCNSPPFIAVSKSLSVCKFRQCSSALPIIFSDLKNLYQNCFSALLMRGWTL